MSVFRFRQWGSALHRYLGLLAFGQVLLWSLSGFLMYSLDFSDLYRDSPPQPLVLSPQTPALHTLQSRLDLLSPGSQLLKVELNNLAGETVYLLSHTKGPALLLSAAGEPLSPLSPKRVRAIALSQYQGKAAISELQLLPKSVGNYVSGVPVYRVVFGDDAKTEMYIDPQTGALLARRKALWGLYNRMWEFHLMKYTPSQPLNKFLLLGFAVLNAGVALTGFMKFFRKKSAML